MVSYKSWILVLGMCTLWGATGCQTASSNCTDCTPCCTDQWEAEIYSQNADTQPAEELQAEHIVNTPAEELQAEHIVNTPAEELQTESQTSPVSRGILPVLRPAQYERQPLGETTLKPHRVNTSQGEALPIFPAPPTGVSVSNR